MTGAVELMAVAQALPAVLRLLDDEIGVHIAVRALGLGHQVDHAVGNLLQRLIGMRSQRIGHRLQPLSQVAVLEHHADEFALFFARRDAEVLDAAALFRTGDAVVERFPLVGNHFRADKLRIIREKTVRDAHVFQFEFTH